MVPSAQAAKPVPITPWGREQVGPVCAVFLGGTASTGLSAAGLCQDGTLVSLGELTSYARLPPCGAFLWLFKSLATFNADVSGHQGFGFGRVGQIGLDRKSVV